MELKNCPFCGSNKIKYSVKTGGVHRGTTIYHASYYCDNCHTYGPRFLIHELGTHHSRYSVERDETYKRISAENWNRRV